MEFKKLMTRKRKKPEEVDYYELFVHASHLSDLAQALKLASDQALHNSLSFTDQLRKWGLRSANNNDYRTFEMVSKVKKKYQQHQKNWKEMGNF